jgi:O-antigen/teichoic acid export membrane protein
MSTAPEEPSPALLTRLRARFSKNSFATGAGYLTIVQIVRLLVLLLSSAIVLRHFGPATFGIIAIALAMFETLLNLQVQVGQAVQTFVPQLLVAKKYGSVRLVLWSGYLLRATSFALLGLMLMLASPWVGEFYRQPEVTDLTFILGLTGLSRILSGPVDVSVLFGMTRYRNIVVLNLLEVAGTLLSAIAAWYFDLSASGYLWALLLSLFPTYLYCWVLYPSIGRQLDWKNAACEETGREWLTKVFRFGLPVSVSVFLYQASLQISILIAGRIFPAVEVGQFGFAVNTARRAWGIVSYLETMLLAKFAKAHTVGRAALERATIVYGGILFAIALSAATPMILFAPEITLILGGREFLAAVPLLQVLVIHFLFRSYEYLRFAIYADHQPGKMLTAIGAKIVAEIAALALLLPALGLLGMVIAHVLSYAVCSAVIAWWAIRVIMEPARIRQMFFYQSGTAAVGVLVLAGAMLLTAMLADFPLILSFGVRAAAALAVCACLLLFLRRAERRLTLAS